MKNYKKSLTITPISYYNNVDFDFGGVEMKRTYQPNNRRRAKKHGFFARKETSVINSRRKKGRKEIIKK